MPGRRIIKLTRYLDNAANWMTCWQLKEHMDVHVKSSGYWIGPPGLRNHYVFVMLRSLY